LSVLSSTRSLSIMDSNHFGSTTYYLIPRPPKLPQSSTRYVAELWLYSRLRPSIQKTQMQMGPEVRKLRGSRSQYRRVRPRPRSIHENPILPAVTGSWYLSRRCGQEHTTHEVEARLACQLSSRPDAPKANTPVPYRHQDWLSGDQIHSHEKA
jgi:hypothetical protein